MPTYIGAATNSNGTSDTTIATSGSLNVSSGDTIVAFTSNFTGSSAIDITSITDTQGNTYVYVGEVSGSATHRSEMWVAYDCAANATNTVTVNFAAAAEGRRVWAANYSGIPDNSIEDSDFQLPSAGTSFTTNNLTTLRDSFLILGLTDWSSQTTVSAASGTTLDYSDGGPDQFAILSKSTTGGGSQALDYTLLASQNYLELVAAFDLGTGSGATNTIIIVPTGPALS